MEPSLGAIIEWVTASGRRAWCCTLLACLTIYLSTAHYAGAVTDGVAASWPGWSLAHRGSLFLDGLPAPRSFALTVAGNGHLVALRTPGVILAGVPMNVLLRPTGWSPLAVGAVTAALMSALAMANMSWLLRRVAPARTAMAGALTLALGTCVWPVASSELWTHGPDLLWLTALLCAAVAQRHVVAGLLTIPAALTRPHLLVAIAVIGLGSGLARRSWVPVATFASSGLAALAGMWTWHAWYLGHGSLLGDAYGGYAVQSVVVGANASNGASDRHGVGESLINLAGFVVSPGYGAVAFTPVVIPLAVVIWRRRTGSPIWAVGAAAGGLAYLVVQSRVNSFSGGGGFYGYRLALEPLLLATPLAVSCLAREDSALLRGAVRLAAAGSLSIAAFGALSSDYWWGSAGNRDWSEWYPLRVLSAAGAHATPALAVSAVVMVGGIAAALRPFAPLLGGSTGTGGLAADAPGRSEGAAPSLRPQHAPGV